MPNSGMVSLTAPKGVLLTCGHGPSLCAASMVVVESEVGDVSRSPLQEGRNFYTFLIE